MYIFQKWGIVMLKLEAFGLFVDNMKDMVEFYRNAIGVDINWDGSSVFVSGKTESGIALNLCERKIISGSIKKPLSYPAGINGTMEICFGVETFSDVDKEYERLIKAGAQPIDEPSTAPWGMRSCFISDPEGNLIEIWSGNDDSV